MQHVETDAVWGGGQLMAFSGIDGKTDFEKGLAGRLSFKGAGIDIKLPEDCQLVFSDTLPRPRLLRGDCLDLWTDAGDVRGAFLDACHFLIEGPCRVGAHGDSLRVVQKGSRTLIGTADNFVPDRVDDDLDAAIAERSRWVNEITLPPALPDATQRTLRKALSVMKTQVCTPEGLIRHRWTTPDRWPHRRMWLWDSVFHAIGWRHIDPALARDMLSAVVDARRTEDGFIPLMADPTERATVTQPPVLALGVKMVNMAEPSPDWIREVYPALAAYVEWDLAHRDSDGAGLAEWLIEDHVTCRSGESGMDNSPRFDTATRLDATDFNAMLALESEILSEFAAELGDLAESRRWAETHARLCRLINERLWNDETGFYVDYDLDAGAQSPALASAGFLPLICGAPSAAQAQRLRDHLADPDMFGTPLPVPSIAARDTEHYQKDMWRGPVWMNINWLIAYGFRRYGMEDAAREIEEKSCAEIERTYLKFGTLFEFFDDRREVEPRELLRKAKNDPSGNSFNLVFHDYGWTTTLYLDWVLGRSRNQGRHA